MLNDLKFNTKREKKNIITEFFENVAPNKEFETSNHLSSHSGHGHHHGDNHHHDHSQQVTSAEAPTKKNIRQASQKQMQPIEEFTQDIQNMQKMMNKELAGIQEQQTGSGSQKPTLKKNILQHQGIQGGTTGVQQIDIMDIQLKMMSKMLSDQNEMLHRINDQITDKQEKQGDLKRTQFYKKRTLLEETKNDEDAEEEIKML